MLSNVLMFWFFATPIIYSWQDGRANGKRCSNSTRSRTSRCRIRKSCSSRARSDTGSGCSRSGVVSGPVSGGYWVFDRLRDSFAEEV